MKRNETIPIPQGYKATPLGIIPQEWEVKRLGDIAEINPRNGKIISQFVTFLTMSDISEQGGIIRENIVPNSSLKSGFTSFKRGDIIIAKITPCFENGKGALLDNITEEYGLGSTEFHVIRCRQCNKFIYYHTMSYAFRKRLESQMTGSAGQKRVPADSISSYKIPVPPLAEQRKIAEVLGLWDKAIEKQLQLIEQLTLRKRGLMQQLLTAKRRLPGFSNPWKEVKLGEICNITTGKLDANAMEDNGIYPFFTCAKDVYKINKYAFDTEALLISGNGEYVGYVHYCKGKFNAYQRTYVLDQFQDNIFYLKYTLQYYLPKRILQTKSSSNTPYIVIGTFQDMIILEPSKAEQTAIAQVLTAADREIELAQQKLELLRQQKRGLMQQLLTGKKRVKNYGDSFKIY